MKFYLYFVIFSFVQLPQKIALISPGPEAGFATLRESESSENLETASNSSARIETLRNRGQRYDEEATRSLLD